MNERIIKERERTPWLILGLSLLLTLVLGLVLLGSRLLSGQSAAVGPTMVSANPVQTAPPASVLKLVPERRSADRVILKLPTPAGSSTVGPKADPGAVVAVGRPAPDFTLKTLDGEAVTLSELRGQPVLLNFWASWCTPCRLETPELIHIRGLPTSIFINREGLVTQIQLGAMSGPQIGTFVTEILE